MNVRNLIPENNQPSQLKPRKFLFNKHSDLSGYLVWLLNAYDDDYIHNIHPSNQPTKYYSQITLLFSIELNKIYPNQCLLSFNLFDSLTIIMPLVKMIVLVNIVKTTSVWEKRKKLVCSCVAFYTIRHTDTRIHAQPHSS